MLFDSKLSVSFENHELYITFSAEYNIIQVKKAQI